MQNEKYRNIENGRDHEIGSTTQLRSPTNCDRQRKLKWKLKLTNVTLSTKDIENENEHDLETQTQTENDPEIQKGNEGEVDTTVVIYLQR